MSQVKGTTLGIQLALTYFHAICFRRDFFVNDLKMGQKDKNSKIYQSLPFTSLLVKLSLGFVN